MVRLLFLFASVLFAQVDLTKQVKGKLPVANGGTASATAADARAVFDAQRAYKYLNLDYQFIRTNGSGVTIDLTTPGSHAGTLAPCPAGINADSVNVAYVYISGGTGAAERVLITAFSLGGSNCTISFTTVNAHTGAWAITSATAGIQEAGLVDNANPHEVYVPAGNHYIYAPITLTGIKALRGAGTGITNIVAAQTDTDILIVPNTGSNGILLEGFNLSQYSTATAGAAITITSKNFPVTVRDVYIYHPWIGLRLSGTAIFLQRLTIEGVRNKGIWTSNDIGGQGTAGNWSDIWISSTVAAPYGIHIQPDLDGLSISRLSIGGFQYGIRVDDAGLVYPHYLSNLQVSNAYIEDSALSGIQVIGGAGLLRGGAFLLNNVRISSIVSPTQAAFSFVYGGPFNTISLSNCFTYGHPVGIIINGVAGFTLVGSNITTPSGVGTVGIQLDNTLSLENKQVTITGSNIGFDPLTGAVTGQVPEYGVFVGAGTNGLSLTGNHLNGSIDAFTGAQRVTSGIVANNPGYNPVGPSAITVTASPFTYTAGPTPEVVYITGGTVSDIKRGSTTVVAASPAQVTLPPFASLTVTYTDAPTMVKDVQ